jgi:hypothetical protein
MKTKIMNLLMEAKNCDQLSKIVSQNLNYINNHPELIIFYLEARRCILRLQFEKCWKTYQLN